MSSKEQTFADNLPIFIANWKKSSNALISLMITGGGFSFLDIGKVPGSSGVLANAFIPYGMSDSSKFAEKGLQQGEINPFLSDDPIKCVGPEATELYSNALDMSNQYEAIQVIVNASLTTNRWRRGDNEAFIWIRNQQREMTRIHYKMNKFSEEDYNNLSEKEIRKARLEEDIKISSIVMHHILPNNISDIDIYAPRYESIWRLNDSHESLFYLNKAGEKYFGATFEKRNRKHENGS